MRSIGNYITPLKTFRITPSSKQSEAFKLKLPLLHGIRGIAALYVVVYHAKFILWSGGTEYLKEFPLSTWNLTDYFFFTVEMLTTAGSQMVIVFFVLSGFFIAMSLQNMEGTLLEKLKKFYLIRCLRIYIPYLVSIAVGILVLLWLARYSPDLYQLKPIREFNIRLIDAYNDLTVSNFLRSLLFLKDREYIGFNFAYWSLLFEGIFYLGVPLFFRFKKNYFVISGLFYLAGMFILNFYHPANVLISYLFEINFYFALGQFAYYNKERIISLFKRKVYKRWLIPSVILLFLAFDFLALLHLMFWANLAASIWALVCMFTLLVYNTNNNYFFKGIKKLGEISYSLYLIHLPVLFIAYACIHKLTGELVFYNRIFYIGILASVIAGWLFYITVEKFSLHLIRKVKQSKRYKQEILLTINRWTAIRG